MKKLILMLIALTMLSCGYNIKTDREIFLSSNQIVEVQTELDEVKEQWLRLKDSLAMVVIQDSIRLERFKDSVKFTNLSRTMCWDKREHRHSCETYGDPLMKATNEEVNQKSDEATYEESEVAMNE